ncbi:DUF4062 domain-containing protein [Agrococcus jejuensis]|uniref:DUF4062 domain-containing protein n=1 Tax=Agrococcus jejuensis TaxID=399736 RepID=UPI00164262CA|nr:DUF4062 domain-containing protein [Agrococcus jejuensis]
MSSTFTDLKDERREVMQALLEMDCLPAGMEMFPAADDDQWTLIQGQIDESDYYVVIVGGRYGSTTPEGISYTEKEYDYAVETGVPVLGFVHSSPNDSPRGKSELDTVAIEKLDAFRAKVKTRLVKPYSNPAELGSVVSRSLMRAMKSSPREGWVRGRFAMAPETRAEIAELRAALSDQKRAAAEEAAHPAAVALNPDYEQGSDKVAIELSISWYFGGHREAEYTLAYTWDSLIELLGPLMIDEASEQSLRRTLAQDMIDSAKREHSELAGRPNLEIDVKDSSWGQVIVQLRALGAIATSTKSHGVTNKTIYWSLTPAGDQHLMKLRATRRQVAV